MMITGYNRPKCCKCEAYAFTNINRNWLCGKCTEKFLKKLREAQDKILFEE